MQISAKIWIILKNKKIPFENWKEYKFWDYTWIEIILPRSYKNIDKEYFQNFGIIWDYLKNNKNSKEYKFNLDLIKTSKKILFSSNFGI